MWMPYQTVNEINNNIIYIYIWLNVRQRVYTCLSHLCAHEWQTHTATIEWCIQFTNISY